MFKWRRGRYYYTGGFYELEDENASVYRGEEEDPKAFQARMNGGREQEFVDMDAHFAEFIAYRELQDKPKADFHQAVFAALLRSITGNGDGKSTKTAYAVISVHEEYVVLRTMGLQPSKQSVVNENGHSYDRLETQSRETGATVVVYFNVDIPFKHYLN